MAINSFQSYMNDLGSYKMKDMFTCSDVIGGLWHYMLKVCLNTKPHIIYPKCRLLHHHCHYSRVECEEAHVMHHYTYSDNKCCFNERVNKVNNSADLSSDIVYLMKSCLVRNMICLTIHLSAKCSHRNIGLWNLKVIVRRLRWKRGQFVVIK